MTPEERALREKAEAEKARKEWMDEAGRLMREGVKLTEERDAAIRELGSVKESRLMCYQEKANVEADLMKVRRERDAEKANSQELGFLVATTVAQRRETECQAAAMRARIENILRELDDGGAVQSAIIKTMEESDAGAAVLEVVRAAVKIVNDDRGCPYCGKVPHEHDCVARDLLAALAKLREKGWSLTR